MTSRLTVNRAELLEGLKQISKLVKKKGVGKGVSDEEILRSGFWEKMDVARGEKRKLIRWASNKPAALVVRQEDVEELVDKALRRVNGI
jgi:hypothetical protein